MALGTRTSTALLKLGLCTRNREASVEVHFLALEPRYSLREEETVVNYKRLLLLTVMLVTVSFYSGAVEALLLFAVLTMRPVC